MNKKKESPSTSILWREEKLTGSKPRQEMPKISSSTASPAQTQHLAKEVIPIQHYETTDIFLGAYLLSSGGDLSGISFNDRQIATFMFTGEGLYQLDREYHTGTALINPVQLRSSLNHLRDILFEMRDRRRNDEKRRRDAPRQRPVS